MVKPSEGSRLLYRNSDRRGLEVGAQGARRVQPQAAVGGKSAGAHRHYHAFFFARTWLSYRGGRHQEAIAIGTAA